MYHRRVDTAMLENTRCVWLAPSRFRGPVLTDYILHIERGSWSALLARCCLLAGYCGLVEKREEDAIFARCLGEELLMS